MGFEATHLGCVRAHNLDQVQSGMLGWHQAQQIGAIVCYLDRMCLTTPGMARAPRAETVTPVAFRTSCGKMAGLRAAIES